MNNFPAKKVSDLVQERLHITVDDSTLENTLMIEYPISDDPPVTMFTEVFLTNSEVIGIAHLKMAGVLKNLVRKCTGFLFSVMSE